MSGFCHFGLVYSWFCDKALTLPSCLVFWWARGFECARAAHTLVYVLYLMLDRGVWIPVLLSCFRPISGFVSGFGHSHSRFGVAVEVCGLEFARAVQLLCPCAFIVFVLLSLVLSCSVWHAACVFHWLHVFMFVMFCVNTRLMSLLIHVSVHTLAHYLGYYLTQNSMSYELIKTGFKLKYLHALPMGTEGKWKTDGLTLTVTYL